MLFKKKAWQNWMRRVSHAYSKLSWLKRRRTLEPSYTVQQIIGETDAAEVLVSDSNFFSLAQPDMLVFSHLGVQFQGKGLLKFIEAQAGVIQPDASTAKGALPTQIYVYLYRMMPTNEFVKSYDYQIQRDMNFVQFCEALGESDAREFIDAFLGVALSNTSFNPQRPWQIDFLNMAERYGHDYHFSFYTGLGTDGMRYEYQRNAEGVWCRV